MLILGRKEGEALLIGDDIRISVVSAERGRVRLAIDAPKSVPILRSELRSAMDANQDAAREETSPMELLGLLAAARAQQKDAGPAPQDGQPPQER